MYKVAIYRAPPQYNSQFWAAIYNSDTLVPSEAVVGQYTRYVASLFTHTRWGARVWANRYIKNTKRHLLKLDGQLIETYEV